MRQTAHSRSTCSGLTGSAYKGVAAEHGDFYRTADLLDLADQALLRRV